jgi:twinkle protein
MMNETNSEFIKHEPCPQCQSRNNLARYSDGHGWCFGCGYREPANGETNEFNNTKIKTDMITGQVEALSKRQIDFDTCKFFNYQTGEYNGSPVQIAPYYNSNYQIVAQHIRFPNKDFIWLGDMNEVGLFGMHKWKGNQKMITITEGELDAMSVSKVQGNKWPVVSVPSGAKSAKKYIKKNLEYLESFEKVVLMFDNDEAGNTASIECAQLFSPKKALVSKLPLKDANDMLVSGRGKDIINHIWNARPYTPEGIIAGADTWDLVMQDDSKECTPYLWEGLNNKTKGIRKGEIVLFTAGSGTGKSQVCREIAFDLIIKGKNVGYIALEESVARTVRGLISIDLNSKIHEEEVRRDFTEETLKKSWDKIQGHTYFHKHFGSTDSENLMSKIRFLVRGCDCDYVVLDHINMVVSGIEGDERKLIDYTMTRLRSLVEELNFGLILVCHMKRLPDKTGHEEGAITSLSHLKGSHGLGQLTDICCGLERSQQNEETKDILTIRVLKNRYNGDTGVACSLHYDRETGRLSEGDFSNVQE